MGDAAPSFADQAKQLLADFQHAMDSAAPISIEMMRHLKSVLDVGTAAHLECETLRNSAHNAQAKAAVLQAEANDLVATISTEGTSP
jgi:hypothetical protein